MNRSTEAAQRCENKNLVYHIRISCLCSCRIIVPFLYTPSDKTYSRLESHQRSSYNPVVCSYVTDDPKPNPQSQSHDNGCNTGTRAEYGKKLRTSVLVLKGHGCGQRPVLSITLAVRIELVSQCMNHECKIKVSAFKKGLHVPINANRVELQQSATPSFQLFPLFGTIICPTA